MTGDTCTTALPRWALVAACALALAYAMMKVVLALKGEAGLAGFPPPPAPQERIVARQLGNAALDFAAAALALAAARRWPRPVAMLLRVTLWGVAALTLLGAGVVVARATRLTATFGPPPGGATGLLVAAGGVVWVGAWVTLAWHATRHPATITIATTVSREQQENRGHR